MNLVAMLVGAVVGLSSTATAGQLTAELSDRLRSAAPDERIPVIVRLKDQAVDRVEPPPDTLPRAERRRLVTEQLQRINQDGQARVAAQVEDAARAGKASSVQRFWLVNATAVEATPEILEKLAEDPTVDSVGLEPRLRITFEDDSDPDPETPPAVEGVHRMRAPQVWNLGYRGAGAVVGSIDSGVARLHNDLESTFRGGANSWFDPFGGSPTPVDEIGHGTHTLGTAVGGNRIGSNYIGVAPKAKWIACRIFLTKKEGDVPLSRAIECMEWMADPDRNPWTDDLPDVVNNSYGERGPCDVNMWDAVRALRLLEVIPVFSAGNEGVAEIPAAYPESMPVGALNRQNEAPWWSGRGPSACYPYTYPDFSAPGTRVRSAWLGGTRRVLTGTSMAAPHVAGTIALMRGRNPNLTVAQIERILMQTSRDLGPAGPDAAYGFGLPDAYRAMLCVGSGAYLCPGTCP